MENKQETIEEVSLRLHPIDLEGAWDSNKQYRDEWIEGAKWQAERMYSEEEVLQLLLRLQQTESYDNLYDWFEQFKKKQL
jgi:hypothetical protein